MTDLVERLRQSAKADLYVDPELLEEAADEIERQYQAITVMQNELQIDMTENARLRERFREVLKLSRVIALARSHTKPRGDRGC